MNERDKEDWRREVSKAERSSEFNAELQSIYDTDLAALATAKHRWARISVSDRIAILKEIKDCVMAVAEDWASTAANQKGIPDGSPLAGEEWLCGPYAILSVCNGLISTLSQVDGKVYLNRLPKRILPNGQTAVRVIPDSIWDRLLLSGVKAEVWMQEGVTASTLGEHAASAYDTAIDARQGKVALVLGAGNVASITPLDAFQKLFLENQVVFVKMNPVNDYLTEFLRASLKPLIDVDALRIHRGNGQAGAYLTNHELVEEIHITGAQSTHDLIVWGIGEEAQKNKAAGNRKNKRLITSELGAVCPCIVVPGPWSATDLRFHAENIATMKMQNSGFNCIAIQHLILPKSWDKVDRLVEHVKLVVAKKTRRKAFYPGASERIDTFRIQNPQALPIERGPDTPPCWIAELNEGDSSWLARTEVFAPAMTLQMIDAPDAEAYLRAAIAIANDRLYGTLGANVLIHPSTIRTIGRKRFEAIIADLQYGAIAINCWTGLAFLSPTIPWGGFPGATIEDVGSGIGTVHNTFMLEKTERTVVEAPFRPFIRSVLTGGFTLLARPPWFVTNRRQHVIGKLLTEFQYKPSWLKLPRILVNTLLG